MRFCNVLDLHVNYMLYWWFHFQCKIPINCLFIYWKCAYILDLDLEDEVHSIWDFCTSSLQECKNNVFPEVGQGVPQISVRFKKSQKNYSVPKPISASPYKVHRGTLASAPKWSVTNQWKADDKKLQKSEKGPPDSGICFWLRSCGLIGGPAMGKQAIFPWREDRLQNLYNVLATYRCKVLANIEIGNKDVALYTLTI